MCSNQRRLTKQVALEFPHSALESDNCIHHLKSISKKSTAKDLARLRRDKIGKSNTGTTSRTVTMTCRQESWYDLKNFFSYRKTRF